MKEEPFEERFDGQVGVKEEPFADQIEEQVRGTLQYYQCAAARWSKTSWPALKTDGTLLVYLF